MSKSDLKVEAKGDMEVVISRTFNAPPQMVFDAHTKPELVRQWLLGPEGWTMPVCDIDLRVGGKYRYVWHKAKTGESMGMGGEFREVTRPEKYVATENFDESWYPGEGLSTTTFEDRDGKTLLTNVMQYESKEARDAVMASPMEDGLAPSYDRLEALVTESSKAAVRGE